jgi:Ca2+/Na+ antiporter
MALITPAFVCFAAVYVLRQMYPPMDRSMPINIFMAPIIFILTAISALAGPILYRSFFAHSQRYLHGVPYAKLFKFERKLTAMALITPYLALVAYGLQFPRFYLAAILLMALYAVYYYYPSQRRISFDEKIFRTNQACSDDPTHSHEQKGKRDHGFDTGSY